MSKQNQTVKEHALPATNYRADNRGPEDIDSIVYHYTGGDDLQVTLNWFSNPKSQGSSHIIIDKDGTIYRCIDP